MFERLSERLSSSELPVLSKFFKTFPVSSGKRLKFGVGSSMP